MKHFRILTAVATLILLPMNLNAQKALEDIKQDPGRSGGVYYAYPVPTEALTPAPKGYKPFYISHYGRHGSRYMLNDMDYQRPLNTLRMAKEANALTPLGLDVLERMEEVWKEAEFHGDELAPLGKRQHRGIAERMFHNYPNLFTGKDARVTARSTTSMRVALSMVAFVERMKELNPEMNLDWETSRANMSYLNSHTKRYDDLKRAPDGWQRDHNRFCARGIDASRFAAALVKDSTFWRPPFNTPNGLMSQLFDVAIDLQDMETPVRMYDIFTPEELYQNWLNGNSWFYHCDADSPFNQGTAIESTRPLLQNIIEEADRAVRGTGETATLRFGHDGNIIPLCAIMHLKDCDARVDDLFAIDRQWRNYEVSPMGANVQLVFYRNDKTGDVVVKFLHNERETSIPVATDMAPYYHWEDVRAFFVKQLAGEVTLAPRNGILNVIGDSYVANHLRPASESWHAKMAEQLGLQYNNYGRNGSCVAFDRTHDGRFNFGPAMWQRYVKMEPKADYVLIIAGHNDADKVGTSRDSLRMFQDSLEVMLTGIEKLCPQARIGYVTPWYVNRPGFAEVTKVIQQVCRKHRIPVLNNCDPKCIVQVRDEEFRQKYFQRRDDTAHLNASGHDLFLPVAKAWFERELLR